MQTYFEAPERYIPPSNPRTVFLAGGITDCPDWQLIAAKRLQDKGLVVFNPRRQHFPMGDDNADKQQITWERNHLTLADCILFWFCKETVQPIALLELGYWLGKGNKPLYVGCHPEYPRLIDVQTQSALSGNWVFDDFNKLIDAVIKRLSVSKF